MNVRYVPPGERVGASEEIQGVVLQGANPGWGEGSDRATGPRGGRGVMQGPGRERRVAGGLGGQRVA